MKRSRNLHLGASPPPASKNSDCVDAGGIEALPAFPHHNFPQHGTESVMSLDDGAKIAVTTTEAQGRGRPAVAADATAAAAFVASFPGRQRKDTSMLSVDCSFGAAADTPTTRRGQNCNDVTIKSHTSRSNHMMMCDEDDRGASHAVAVSDILSLDPTDIDTGSVRQVSFDRHRLPPTASSMSGTGLTPSTSVGSYSGIRSMSSSSAVGCCMTDVTSSFLSMSPCSAATDASGIPGWSPVSVTSTSASTPMQLPSQQIDNTNNATGRSTAASSWRDNGDNVNNNNKRSSSGSDSCGRTIPATTFGRIRSNRRKRSLHRQPPSKCLSSLAAEVSILESDGDDNCCNDSGSDSDEDSFPSNTGSTWDKPNRTSTTDTFSSNYCYDGRSSFNTRPYKRQPSSCEWDPHGSSSISGSHRAPTSSRRSSSIVSGTDASSVSPCFSHTSSNDDQQRGSAMSPLLLSQSAPSGLVGEWGQFVYVISADERNGGNKKERPQPLAFSPGLGGLRCIPGRTGDSAASSSSTARVDTSTNLPYFPKSRRRGSSGRVTLRRRASSVGSHHDMTPAGGTGGSNRRRFAITARFAGGTKSAVARAHSSSLFLQDTSIQGKIGSGGPSPPPPSPSLGPTSVRQSSGNCTKSKQPLTPRLSLDDVSFAMDNMQV